MKNYIRKTASIFLLGILLISCEDFLTVTDKGSISPDNFPSSAEQANLLLTSAYAGSHAPGLYAFYWLPMGIHLYDHTSDMNGSYDERGSSQMNQTYIDSRYITQSYLDIFKWIGFSNTALEGIRGYREQALASEKEPHGVLDYMEGQALFFRGLAYWHGQIFFEIDPGGLGLPLFEKNPEGLGEMKAVRATVKDSWDFVINDFKKSAELLEGCQTEPYRVDEWSAKGMLAKAYMQAGYPDSAKTVIEDIINNSGKTLVPFSVYQDMFYGNSANEFNSESLYEIDMTVNMSQNGPWAGYTSGSGMPMVFAPWSMNLDIRFRRGQEDKPENDPLLGEYDIVTSTMGGWGNNYIHDANVRRFGFTGNPAPRHTINPAFQFPPAARSIDNYPYKFAAPDENYTQESLDLKTDKTKVDPRLMISTGQPFVDRFIDDRGRETFYDKSGELNNFPEILAFQHRKFTNTGGTEAKINYSSGANYPVVRLADIYLLYAEILKDSDPARALEYVNKVHRRAYGYDPDTPCPYDYQTLTDRTKTTDPADHLANDVIKYERWAELFAEGQWWYDVRRWKIGQQEVSFYKETRNGTLVFSGDDYYVQPIPKLELERNSNIIQSGNYPSVR